MQQITCCPTSEIEQQIMLAESKMCNSEEIFNPRFLEKINGDIKIQVTMNDRVGKWREGNNQYIQCRMKNTLVL